MPVFLFICFHDICKNVNGVLHFYRPDVHSIYASFSTKTFISSNAKRVEVQPFSGLVGASTGGQNHSELTHVEIIL